MSFDPRSFRHKKKEKKNPPNIPEYYAKYKIEIGLSFV